MRGIMLCCLIFLHVIQKYCVSQGFLHVIQKHTQTFGTQPHPNHPFPSSSAPWLPINISHLPEDTHRPNHPHPFHIGLRHQYLAWWSMQMSTAKTSAHHTSTLIPAHLICTQLHPHHPAIHIPLPRIPTNHTAHIPSILV